MDGGQIWLQQAFDGGCVNYTDATAEGRFYTLNLSTSFTTRSDFMTILQNTSVVGGSSSNFAPNYLDGAILANDDEFFLYGGSSRNIDDSESSSTPADNTILKYEASQYGAYRSNWSPNWRYEDLSDNVTSYITNGAGASAPSEELAFYFSGMHAPGWGSFTWNEMQARETAHTLITVDMSSMRDETWSNVTLPDYIPGRANAELIWVPVSKSGILVAVGGVINPVELWRNSKLNESQIAESKRISPTLMESVSLYDVDSKEWYLQKTTGDIPGQLTQFCSVVASAPDNSSYNIYIYGGYDGLDYSQTPSDDVYILSLPSFKWIKAYKGTGSHGRSSHKCFKPYPNQMFAVGGIHGSSTECVDGGIVVNFDLNGLTFRSDYDPNQWSEYKVPDLVTAEIGGTSSGGATKTAPTSWTNDSLSSLFEQKYTKSMTTFYPYASSSAEGGDATSGGGLPHWASAVIGVLVGLFGVALILAGIWFYLRRRRRAQAREAEASSAAKAERDADTSQSAQFMYGSGPTAPVPGPMSKSTAEATTETNTSTVPDSLSTSLSPRTVESGGDELYEMHDSSPAELPTSYNWTNTPDTSPELSASRFPLPVPPESGSSSTAGHHRSPSTVSTVPSISIDNVVSGRQSHFRESFSSEGGEKKRARHGSGFSDVSAISDERDKFTGSEKIHEEE
ncbi:unnamed protein product [Penicillium manginii]